MIAMVAKSLIEKNSELQQQAVDKAEDVTFQEEMQQVQRLYNETLIELE